MTTGVDLIRRVQSLGASITIQSGNLVLDAPADFPNEVIALLREHKSNVLQTLARGVGPPPAKDMSGLLAWASELAEKGVELTEPVSFREAPLRTITTDRVSYYAAHYLKTVAYARLQQRIGGWGRFTPNWWKERENDSFYALTALRWAVQTQGVEGADR